MRIVQICVDALDDLVSFTQAINNWPAVIVSGLLTLSMIVGVTLLIPWVWVVVAVSAGAMAGGWALVSLILTNPRVRSRLLGLHGLAMGFASVAVITALKPELVAGLKSPTYAAVILAALLSFVAHEFARELSLRAS